MTAQLFKGVALGSQFNLAEYRAKIGAMSDAEYRKRGQR